MAVGLWGIQPSEFWKMTMAEWWWVYDSKVGEPKYGSLTQSEVEELYEDLNNGGFGRT